jgi:hypothetical protein
MQKPLNAILRWLVKRTIVSNELGSEYEVTEVEIYNGRLNIYIEQLPYPTWPDATA